MNTKPVYLPAAVDQLATGDREVFCLIPEDCWEIKRRRIAYVRIFRALRSAGIMAHIWWVYYREDAHGEPETVFRLTAKSAP
jgi:hypothetical protein